MIDTSIARGEKPVVNTTTEGVFIYKLESEENPKTLIKVKVTVACDWRVSSRLTNTTF